MTVSQRRAGNEIIYSGNTESIIIVMFIGNPSVQYGSVGGEKCSNNVSCFMFDSKLNMIVITVFSLSRTLFCILYLVGLFSRHMYMEYRTPGILHAFYTRYMCTHFVS